VVKTYRSSMEVRCLDMQECVKMDVAVAVFVRWALKALAERLQAGLIALPEHALLVEDLHATVKQGTRARVHAPHLATGAKRDAEGRVDVREALVDLLAMATKEARADERPYLPLIGGIVERGNLSERIAAALEPHVKDEDAFTDAARRVYIELSDALTENRPWKGRA
jgi:hypothetical protein